MKTYIVPVSLNVLHQHMASAITYLGFMTAPHTEFWLVKECHVEAFGPKHVFRVTLVKQVGVSCHGFPPQRYIVGQDGLLLGFKPFASGVATIKQITRRVRKHGWRLTSPMEGNEVRI